MGVAWLNKKITSRGISLVEVVVGVTLLALVVVVVLHSMTLFLAARGEIMQKTKALYLAEEGLEILRYLRDEDWNVLSSELSVDTPYYLVASSTFVGTTTQPELIDGVYLRTFELKEVYRNNSSDDIVASTSGSNYVDAGSREVVMRVGFADSTTTVRTVLTNLFDI